jgi:hypothetical protein
MGPHNCVHVLFTVGRVLRSDLSNYNLCIRNLGGRVPTYGFLVTANLGKVCLGKFMNELYTQQRSSLD